MLPQVSSSPPKPNELETVVAKRRELSWKVASDLFSSFKYAWSGISYAFQTQRNFRIHVSVCVIALGLGVFLHLKSVEIAVIGVTGCGGRFRARPRAVLTDSDGPGWIKKETHLWHSHRQSRKRNAAQCALDGGVRGSP